MVYAILFYTNRLTSECIKQEPPGSIGLLLHNLLIMIVTGTNSVSFVTRQAYFLKENWQWTCHFSGEQLAFLTFESRLSKKDPFLESLKIRTCYIQNSGPVEEFLK